MGHFDGDPFGTVFLRFLMATHTMCCYLHGKRNGGIHGGPFGMVLSALFDDNAHDVLLFARKTPGATPETLVGSWRYVGANINEREG